MTIVGSFQGYRRLKTDKIRCQVHDADSYIIDFKNGAAVK